MEKARRQWRTRTLKRCHAQRLYKTWLGWDASAKLSTHGGSQERKPGDEQNKG